MSTQVVVALALLGGMMVLALVGTLLRSRRAKSSQQPDLIASSPVHRLHIWTVALIVGAGAIALALALVLAISLS